MKVSDDVREIAIAQLEAVLPSYQDDGQTTELLRGILTGNDGRARVATILRSYATDAEITRLGQILPQVVAELGEELGSVLDSILDLASSAPPHEAQALDAAMGAASNAEVEQVDRTVALIVEALLAGGQRGNATREVLTSSSGSSFLEKYGSRLDEKLLEELGTRDPDHPAFEAAEYAARRFHDVGNESQTRLRTILTNWLDSDPDWGAETGRVVKQMSLTANQRRPLIRSLLRAAESASSPSLRAEALVEASALTSDSRPARKLLSDAVTRMLRSGDQANVEAVAIAGIATPE